MAVASKKIPAPDRVRIRRALLSVFDKAGLESLAGRLSQHGVELLSTGGSARLLKQAGLTVADVSEVTGFPEIMDGRVKTLHPAIHGGLLGIRDDAGHAGEMKEHGIGGIDLLVVNLYPFEEVRAAGADYATTVENVDIGGPAMIRAAAKNHAYVAVIVDPDDYAELLAELDANDGALGYAFRQRLAAKAYARTAAYDAAISNWFAEALHITDPKYRTVGGRLKQVMRYGENPHQSAGFYVTGEPRPGVATARQLQGKVLSYNNINDTDAAFECVAEFDPSKGPACAIIKHANPCGVALGTSLADAYRKALACDSVSAFGGIVALNQPLDKEAAEEIVKVFTEVIIAPDASEEAVAIVAAKKNLRLLVTGGLPDPRAPGLAAKTVAGGLLVQSRDSGSVDETALKVVTKAVPDAQQLDDLKIRVQGGQARQVERDRLCQGRRDGRHRGRTDEPRRFGAHRRTQGGGRRQRTRPDRAADKGLRRRLRRLLSVRRRAYVGHRGGRRGRHSAGGFRERQGRDRRGRRGGHRHGLHRDAALPALSRPRRLGPLLALRPLMPVPPGRGRSSFRLRPPSWRA